MSQYDLLVQALQEQQMLSQAQAGHEGVMSRFRPIEQKYEDVNTSRFKRGLMGAGEAIVDAIRRPGAQKQYYSGLEEALSSARGVDEIKAQIEMMAQVRAAEEQRAYDQQQELAKFQRENQAKVELQKQKDSASMDRTKVSTNKPNLTFNIPAGYMPVDPNNPMGGVVPIPGSEQDMERKQAEEKAASRSLSNRASYGNLINVADKALEAISPTTTGVVGAAAGQIPGTNRKALEGYLTTLKANLGFDRLQQMRAESPTGGALGQVAVQELVSLQSTLASLDPDQPPEVLADNIRTVQNHYGRFLSALDGVDPDGAAGGDGGLEEMARKAIEAGADPEAVRARLEELKRGR